MGHYCRGRHLYNYNSINRIKSVLHPSKFTWNLKLTQFAKESHLPISSIHLHFWGVYGYCPSMSFRSQPPSPEGWHSHLRHGRYWWCSPGRCLGRWGHSEGESQRAACAFRSPRNSGPRPNSDSSYLRSANEMKLPIHCSLTFWIYGIPSKHTYGWIRVETNEKMREPPRKRIQGASLSAYATLRSLRILRSWGLLAMEDVVYERFSRLPFRVHPDCIWAFWSFVMIKGQEIVLCHIYSS